MRALVSMNMLAFQHRHEDPIAVEHVAKVVVSVTPRLIRRTLPFVLAAVRSPWRPPRPLRGPPLPLHYHKGGTDVGVCPVSTTHSTLKSDHALTTTRKQAKARVFFVERATFRLQKAAQQPPWG